MKDSILELLYKFAKDKKLLHEIARRVIYFTYPIILYVFMRILGLIPIKKIQCRNSTSESTQFDLFMSDVDILIIVDELDFAEKIASLYRFLKIFFLNLGEVELLTQDEYIEMMTLKNKKYWFVFENINLLKKLKREELKIETSLSNYQRMKSLRSIQRAYKKLDKDFLNKIQFIEVDEVIKGEHFSSFIGINLKIKEGILTIENLNILNGLVSCLPGECELFQKCSNLEVKKLIFETELIISKCSYRYMKFFENKKDIELKSLLRWENYLKESMEYI